MRLINNTYLATCFLVLVFSQDIYSQQTNQGKPGRIDTHIHLYDTNREGSSTFLNPEKHKKIYFPHLAFEFLEVAQPAGINYAVVVEASKRREDNFWAMEIVNHSENLLAFVANLDPRDPDYISDLDALSKNKKFRGIRIRPQTPIDISDEKVLENLGELAKRNLVLELGPNDGPVKAIETISKRYPKMNIIFDHMAGGRIKNGKIVPENWGDRLDSLAALPNTFCKISSLFDLSGQVPAPLEWQYYRQYIDSVIQAFGAGRVMFGSNWTLSEMYGPYSALINTCNQYLENTSVIDPEKFYTENAVKAYGLTILNSKSNEKNEKH